MSQTQNVMAPFLMHKNFTMSTIVLLRKVTLFLFSKEYIKSSFFQINRQSSISSDAIPFHKNLYDIKLNVSIMEH